jgi:transposase InsO family protein
MPWRETSVMEERREFVRLAGLEGSNRRELCRRFGISAEAGYKWLRRWAEGETDCRDRSRRPHHSPARSAPEMEAAVLVVRDQHPAWGARKIAAVLAREEGTVPAASTIHAILTRHGRITPPQGGADARLRFEREEPNSLWQMDFKGWSRLGNGERLHPLTIIDDHSRFALCIAACPDETGTTVKRQLEQVFRHYGLPLAFYADNGKPWGDSHARQWSKFGIWLLKLGIELIHSRPYHPQGRGKNERFHRSMDDEVFAMRPMANHAEAQRAFDAWRPVYNFKRPHEGIGFTTPAQRYRPSPRAMPDKLPVVEYGSSDTVRSISQTKCCVVFKGRNWKVPEAFGGERLAIRPLAKDGAYGVYFGAHLIRTIDLNQPKSVNYVSEHTSTISPG